VSSKFHGQARVIPGVCVQSRGVTPAGIASIGRYGLTTPKALSRPAARGRLVACAPQHRRHVYILVALPAKHPVNCNLQVWSAFREPSFGHGLMDFLNDTTAVWNWQRNQDPIAAVNSDKASPLACSIHLDPNPYPEPKPT